MAVLKRYNGTSWEPVVGSTPIDASGFNGNLAATDDTIQKVAQKVDDLTVSAPPVDLGLPTAVAFRLYA